MLEVGDAVRGGWGAGIGGGCFILWEQDIKMVLSSLTVSF